MQDIRLHLAALNYSRNAAEGLARTKNNVEGWHWDVTTLFRSNDPNIRNFFEKDLLGATNQNLKINNSASGNENYRHKKYRVRIENNKTM